MNKAVLWVGVLVLALAGSGAWWWWNSQRAAERAAAEAAAQAAAAAASAVAAETPAAPVVAAPAIAHPIEAASAAAASAPVAADLSSTLVALLGRQAVLSMLQTDDLARRVAATVDNLGRAEAPSRLWPVVPTAGRFSVVGAAGSEAIGIANGARYAPFVSLVEAVDMRQLAAAYVRFYPQFQQAYVDLGYPKGYFNDRLVQVIDLLLATPRVAEPVAVFRPTVNSPVQPARPWVLYEFADPALRTLASGQKILLRMGRANAERLQRKLAELRTLVARGVGPR